MLAESTQKRHINTTNTAARAKVKSKPLDRRGSSVIDPIVRDD